MAAAGTATPGTAKTANRHFWQFRNIAGGQSAELMLYGDIAQYSWYKDDVTAKQFADELAALGPVSEITVRINSGGGDIFAAQAIGNLLEQNAATVTAQIDGLCASAATIVACHCDRVVAANDSIYMIHPVRMGICDYMGKEDLRQCMDALDAIRDTITSLYARKTGRTQEDVAAQMDATSWWTSSQAKENGFVDELTNEEETVVENRSGFLFVNSVAAGLPIDKAPDFVQNRIQNSGLQNTHPAGQPERDKGDGSDMDIKNANDLRAAYPDLVNQIESEAASAERNRIKAIEDMALPGDEAAVNAAKFDKPVAASEYAVAAMQRMKAQGQSYLDKTKEDAKNSGAAGVGQGAQDPKGAKNAAESEMLNAIRRANGVEDKK